MRHTSVALALWTAIPILYGQNPRTPLTAESFAHPPAVDRPWVRMNMPPTADPAELKVEIEQLHDKGIAGVEVGQGAFPNNGQLVALLTAANQFGMKISLSHGPTQNPAGYSIDSDNARKSLFLGRVTVAAGSTFDGPLPPPTLTQGGRNGFGMAPGRGVAGSRGPTGPPPATGPGGRGVLQAKRTTLVAVLGYRCVQSTCPEKGPVELDRSSVLDLTSSASAGHLQWIAPLTPAGQWQLIAFWTRGVFAQPDPFSEEGTAELINSMETGLSPEVKALLKINGGDIFYDSHSVDRGSPDELWTNKMAEEFSQRCHYSLIPNLPALFREIFDFDDGSAPRIRDDFYAVRGDLWLTKHIAPMRAWVRTYNNLLRVQVEGEANMTIPITDMISATAAVDRPEHENLFVGDEIDNYLPMASANHMTGNSWYSTECCAALSQNYAETFQDLIIRMHRSYVGGITKIVYHVYPYRDSPTSKWPGYHSFGQAGFSNAWGPRNPIWTDAGMYNDYLARLQQALTQGGAKTDVAVYMQNYLYPPSQSIKTRHWGDMKLAEAGYTRDYLNPEMLNLPIAKVSGHRLAPDGPSYKALIIDSEQGPPTDPVKTSMPVAVAEKILAFARAGLPVVVVGSPPDRTPGNTPQDDAVLKALIAQLLAERSVTRVSHEADVPAKLQLLGIRPAAEPGQPSSLLSIRRHDAATATNYYFFYNQGIVSPEDEPGTLFEPATGQPVEREVSLEGKGHPYLLDAWSGKITPIAQYKSGDGRVTVKVRLSRDNAMLIALAEDPKRFGVAKPSIPSVIGNAAATIDLTKATWHIVAEDWQPANAYVTTFGPAASETLKTKVEIDVTALRAWPEIPELQNVSGLATYTTSFDWPNKAEGAILNLGEVFDSFTLKINDQAVPIDQLSAEAGIGPYLKVGRNTISVRVATTLNNRLAKIDDDVAKRGIVQPYGLVGPVTIKPVPARRR